MAQDHSFDVVSKVNLQELRNAVWQAQKEIGTRFDFRGSRAAVVSDEPTGLLTLTADHEAQLRGVLEVLESKLARRGVAVNAVAWQSPEALPSGGMKRLGQLQQGLSPDHARAISRTIKDMDVKVQARIEGDTVRVTARQIDDLQTVVAALKAKDFGISLQVENFR